MANTVDGLGKGAKAAAGLYLGLIIGVPITFCCCCIIVWTVIYCVCIKKKKVENTPQHMVVPPTDQSHVNNTYDSTMG